MPGISDAIGNEFERKVGEMFPDWDRTIDGRLLPDFDSPIFFAEAKTGFYNFGVQIKDYQVSSFGLLQKPVIYILGFHNFDHALRRLGRKSDEKRAEILKEQMSLDSIYIVEQSIIERIWNREHRSSKKAGRIYCTLKKRFLDGIVDDSPVKRNGSTLNSQKYYGLRKSELILQKPNQEEGIPVTAILRADQTRVADYFRKREILT